MSQFTKKAITQSTLKLAAKRPVNKITVRDIVNDCNITRNTFYYYYKDIYDVLDQALIAEVEKVIDRSNTHEETDDAFFALVKFVLNHKSVLKNIYLALGDKKATSYLSEKLHGLMFRYIEQEAVGLDADKTDIGIITVFYEEAVLGILVRWLRGNMPQELPGDLVDIFTRLRLIFNGQIRTMLINAIDARKKLMSQNGAENF